MSVPTMLAVGGDTVALSIMAIALLAIGAQWIAWKLRVPSILLLLGVGFLAGPGAVLLFGLESPPLNPNAIFGDLLLPLVSVCVGLILYEGGLTLRFAEIRGQAGRVVTLLVSVGALVTWGLAALAGVVILGLEVPLAVLLGAVLIVTGPTVIGPLLSHIRPAGQVGPVLRWEGIVIDPIGALAAVLVLEVILIGNPAEATGEVLLALLMTVLVGGGLGVATALLLMAVMERFWIPEQLQNPVSLMLVVMALTVSNLIQEESGLLATTVMGVVLSNQRRVDTRHILEFKENLRVLIIGALFVVLAARIEPADLRELSWVGMLGFLAVLVVLVRPASVFASTIGTGMPLNERLMLCCMAPRGIVAAAVASAFALSLEAAGTVENPGRLTALTFSVIMGTVVVYALLSPLAARRLGVADQDPAGLVVIGASALARQLAGALAKRKIRVLLVDTNRGNVTTAKLQGLEAAYGNVLDDTTFDSLDLRGIGRAMALTPNAEVNTLALQRFERVLGKANVFRIPVRAGTKQDPTGDAGRVQAQHGRRLFNREVDLQGLERRVSEGWVLKTTTLSEAFGFEAYRTLYGAGLMVLFVQRRDGTLAIPTADRAVTPEVGDTVIALIDPEQLFMPGPAPASPSAEGAAAEAERSESAESGVG